MHSDSNKAESPQAAVSNDRIRSLFSLLSEVDHSDPALRQDGEGNDALPCRGPAAGQAGHDRSGRLAPWQLRRVIDYMEAHFPERVALATLASRIKLSPAHFSRAFKASTGVAPYQWQLAVRVRRAQHMLAVSDASLGEIALSTGFSDTVHFGRTFRKHVGVTPGAWRNRRKR